MRQELKPIKHRGSALLLLLGSLFLGACTSIAPDEVTDEPPLTTEPTSEATPEITIPVAPTLTTIPDTPIPTLEARQLVYYAAPSPNGQWLAVADNRGVQVHSTDTFEVLWRAPLEGMSDDLRVNMIHIVWTADSSAFNVINSQAIYDPVLFIVYLSRFEAQTGALLWQHQFQDSDYLSFAPDGSTLVATSGRSKQLDIQLELWDAVSQQNTGTLELPPHGAASFIQTANFSPDSTLIAGRISLNYVTEQVFVPGVVSKTGISEEIPALYIWDAKTGAQAAKLEHPEQMPIGDPIFWSSDGSRVIAGSTARILFWDTANWDFHSEIYFDPRFNYPGPVALSPDGDTLFAFLSYITTGPGEFVRSMGRWDVSSFQELSMDSRLQALLDADQYGAMIGWLPDGQTLLLKIGSEIFHVNMKSGEIITSYPIPEPDHQAWWSGVYRAQYFSLSPDGMYLYALTPLAVVVYDAQTGEVLHQLED